MDKKDFEKLNLTPIEDLIAEDFGEAGTPEREQFDMECDAFIIGEQLKDERLRAGLTQEQLADKIGSTPPVQRRGRRRQGKQEWPALRIPFGLRSLGV